MNRQALPQVSEPRDRKFGVNREAPPRDLHHLSRQRRPKGQELVEFAIAIPLLLLVVFGVMDLGRMFHALITITNAAREGARYGIIFPEDTNEILSITRREAQESGIDLSSANSTVQINFPQGFGPQLPIRVTVTYRFQLFMGGILPYQTLTLVRSAEMMVP